MSRQQGTGMLTLAEWFDRCQGGARPWLILGKGPSFSHHPDYDLKPFHTFALNHAVRELRVTAAHFVDYDAFEACAEVVRQNARFLLMPQRPHVRNRPGRITLAQYADQHPVLHQLQQEGRLVGYHLSTGGRESPDGTPVIPVKFFSVEAALWILVTCGVRTVKSLGIDGGADYSEAFSDLRGSTLLSNTRVSFDEQFQEIARIIHETGVDYAPLNVESPIRVFIATTASQRLADEVLAYSISRHTSMRCEVTPMRDLPVPIPTDPNRRSRTPFSFSRFLIPKLAGFHGRAIYMDADMQVFRDVRELWDRPFNDLHVLYTAQPEGGRPDQFSVLLLDCDALCWQIEEIVRGLDEERYTYEELLHGFCIVPPERIGATLPGWWNSLERYQPGETGLIHYTDMHTQPWVSLDNSRGHLWVEALIQAIREERIPETLVEDEVLCGHARPSLLEQVRRGRSRGWLGLKRADRKFVAPYRAFLRGGSGHRPWWRKALAPFRR